MLIVLILMAIGGGAYWLLQMRQADAVHGTLAERVGDLRGQVGELREAQWKMREAVDSLREEQDFRNQLLPPAEPHG